jgi:hypothetical protein
MWSHLLVFACALLLLPAQALAGAKEKVAALGVPHGARSEIDAACQKRDAAREANALVSPPL